MQPYVVGDGLFPMKRMNFQETASWTGGGCWFVLTGHAPGSTTTLERRGLAGHFSPFMRLALLCDGVPDEAHAAPFKFLT